MRRGGLVWGEMVRRGESPARALAVSVGAPIETRGPVFFRGHQAAFWHPGILAKLFAANAAARAVRRKVTRWIVVDQDDNDPWRVRYPVRKADGGDRGPNVAAGWGGRQSAWSMGTCRCAIGRRSVRRCCRSSGRARATRPRGWEKGCTGFGSSLGEAEGIRGRSIESAAVQLTNAACGPASSEDPTRLPAIMARRMDSNDASVSGNRRSRRCAPIRIG